MNYLRPGPGQRHAEAIERVMSLSAAVGSWFRERRSWRAAAILTLALALAGGPEALAHQASITHSTVALAHDQTSLTYRIKFQPPDLSEALGLGEDVNPTDEAVAAGQERLLDHVLDRVTVKDGEEACPIERLGAEVVHQGGRFVEVSWRVQCPAPFRTLVIEYDLFFDLDLLHRGLIQVIYRDERAVAELRRGESRFVWDLDEPPPSGLFGFLVSGIEHIVLGFDHIAFLLGLLLVVVIARAGPGRHDWARRELGQALRYTAVIVTSFTVAHSLTLVAASLSWIALDDRVVESVIAASILYVAVENVLKPDTRHRFAITFFFGLIHGLGFASMLRVMLPPEDVVWPLLVFNLGVEIGQLAVVIVILPLLHLAVRVMGPARYRAVFLPAGAGVLVVLGALWLVERAFEVSIFGF